MTRLTSTRRLVMSVLGVIVGTVASGHVSVAWAQAQVTVLYRFDVSAEGYGASALIQGPDGTLYGTTGKSDPTPSQAIFRLNPDGSSFGVLRTFTEPERLNFSLLLHSDGMLYGTTSGFDGLVRVGSIFRLAPDGSGFTEVYRFSDSLPGGLLEGLDGTLYGITGCSDSQGDPGTVFRVGPDGSNFTILHSFSFTEPDGYCPNGPLLIGSDGRLYGTTHYDGVSDAGTVFALATDGSGFRVLHTFRPQVDGQYPAAGLIQGFDGMLYGTTYRGGPDPPKDFGTVFRLAPDGSSFATLYNFQGSPDDGGLPMTRLVQGTDGMLYGTTHIVFQLAPDGTGFARVLDYGAYLSTGNDGTLFGNSGLTVFALTLPSSTEGGVVATALTPRR